MPKPVGGLWLFAGCNGAGKSTFIKGALADDGPLAGVSLLNPDLLTKELLREAGYETYGNVPEDVYRKCFVRAAEQMENTARETLSRRQTVCIETVLSTRKYIDLVAVAKENRVRFFLVYVLLNSPQLAVERVRARVAKGGQEAGSLLEKHPLRWQHAILTLLPDAFGHVGLGFCKHSGELRTAFPLCVDVATVNPGGGCRTV